MTMLAQAIIRALIYLLQIFSWLIVIEALLSWVLDPLHPIMEFIRRFTGPVLSPFRDLMERLPVGGLPVDISPLLALIVIQIIITVLYRFV